MGESRTSILLVSLRDHEGWRPDHPVTCSGSRCTLSTVLLEQVYIAGFDCRLASDARTRRPRRAFTAIASSSPANLGVSYWEGKLIHPRSAAASGRQPKDTGSLVMLA